MFFGICKPSLDIRYVTISDGLSSSPASAIDVAIKKVLGCIRSAINSGYGDGLTFFLSSFSNPSHTSMTFGGGLGLMNEIPLSTAVVDPFVVVVFGTYLSMGIDKNWRVQ
nr:seed lectin-like [Ipomoea trifida]